VASVIDCVDSDEEVMHKFDVVKGDVTSAISNSHGLGVADLVVVEPGSIPVTTSGKGETSGLCRAVPAGSVRPLGRLGSTPWEVARAGLPGYH
jgi:hypothetical protein